LLCQIASSTPPYNGDVNVSTVKVTANNLCDSPSCGALSSVKVLMSMGPLFFCGHHFTDNELALRKQSTLVSIVDERGLIAVAELTPADRE
jgi:hypothetical protein